MNKHAFFFKNFLGQNVEFNAVRALIFSGGLSIILKVFGLLKEVVLAKFFGVSTALDFYILAMLSLLFFVNPIAGTIGTMLTQKYVETIQTSKIVGAILYRKSISYCCYSILFLMFLQFVVLQAPTLTSSFSGVDQTFDIKQLVVLAPIALLSSISVINGAVLTGEKRFIEVSSFPALVPIVITVFILLNISGNLFYSLLIGTLAGYALETVFGIAALKNLWKNPLIKKSREQARTRLAEMRRNFIPLFSASLIMGGCIVVDQFMAVLAGGGAVSIVNFGTRLPFGLLSIIGVVWVVLYPIFSELVTKNKYQELRKLYLKSVKLSIFILLPSCFLGSYFSAELISLLFQRGAFDAGATEIVSEFQSYYICYIPFYTIIILSIRVANSFQDQKIILIGNGLLLIFNIVLNFVFIDLFGVIGIALATLIANICVSIFWFFTVMFTINSDVSSQNFKNISLSIQFRKKIKSDVEQEAIITSSQNILKLILQYFATRAIIITRTCKESFLAKSDANSISRSDKVLFLDLGANLGQAYDWFRKIYSNKNIHFVLFEPNPFCCEKLRKRAEIIKGDVELIEAAVGHYSGNTPLFGISEENGELYPVGGSILRPVEKQDLGSLNQREINVRVIDFCDYLKTKNHMFNKTIVKMDIEGAEILLLEKLMESGIIHMIDVLYVEFHSRFQLTSEPEQIRKKEAEIINKLQNIHGLKFRIWH